MADDIVTRLRWIVEEGLYSRGSAYDDTLRAAADEIERLRAAEQGRIANLRMLNEANAELSRLRAAGDALAEQITKPCRCVEAHDGAINETCAPCAACFDWEEARRD